MKTYAILLIVHDDLLDGDQGTRLLRSCTMDLARCRVRGRPSGKHASRNSPEGALAELAKDLIVGDSGATDIAIPRSLMGNGKAPRRERCARLVGFVDAHGR